MNLDLKKEQFVQLRATGTSLSKISQQINISKTTLIKWSRDLESDIHNHKNLLLDDLKEKFISDRSQQLSFLQSLRDRIEEELSKRTFEDVSTDKLVKNYLSLESIIEGRLAVSFKSPDDLEKIDMDEVFSPKFWK